MIRNREGEMVMEERKRWREKERKKERIGERKSIFSSILRKKDRER